MMLVKKELNVNQIAALMSFVFNLGEVHFAESTLLKVINKDANDFNGVKEEFMRWNHVNGVVSNGLTRRREGEFNLYSN